MVRCFTLFYLSGNKIYLMREMQENYYLVLFMFVSQLYFYALGPIVISILI